LGYSQVKITLPAVLNIHSALIFAMHPPMIELMFVFTKQQTNKHNLPSQPTRKINLASKSMTSIVSIERGDKY